MSLGASAKEEEIISACRLSFFALSICLLFSLEVSRDTGFVVAFSIVRQQAINELSQFRKENPRERERQRERSLALRSGLGKMGSTEEPERKRRHLNNNNNNNAHSVSPPLKKQQPLTPSCDEKKVQGVLQPMVLCRFSFLWKLELEFEALKTSCYVFLLLFCVSDFRLPCNQFLKLSSPSFLLAWRVTPFVSCSKHSPNISESFSFIPQEEGCIKFSLLGLWCFASVTQICSEPCRCSSRRWRRQRLVFSSVVKEVQ